MAEQKGILPFSGKLGDTVGYSRGKKHFKRAKPASYQPGEESQKSGAEFGEGSKACVVLKKAIEPLILKHFKSDLHNRLASKFREIIRTGQIGKKGKRTVFDGNLQMLKGFQLNPKTNFSNLCSMVLSSRITAEELKINIEAFDWKSKIKVPDHADSVKIGLCFVFIDFNTEIFNTLNANQIVMERNRNFPGGLIKINIPKQEELGVFIVMNIFFESKLSSHSYMIENRNYQAGVILDVAHIKKGALVEFVGEQIPEKTVKPAIVPDVFWQLGENNEM